MKYILIAGLTILIINTAQAGINGTVSVDAKNVNGNVGWSTELVCQHHGTTHNTSGNVQTAHIIYSLCDNLTNKCTKRQITWNLQPDQYWNHQWTTSQWMTYKYPGHYEYTCTTFVSEIGQADKQGWVEIH